MSLKEGQRLFSILLFSVFLCFLTHSKAYAVQLELEVGRVKLLKNKIKIPGDSGTLFDTTEVSPTEDYFYRLNLYWPLQGKSSPYQLNFYVFECLLLLGSHLKY